MQRYPKIYGLHTQGNAVTQYASKQEWVLHESIHQSSHQLFNNHWKSLVSQVLLLAVGLQRWMRCKPSGSLMFPEVWSFECKLGKVRDWGECCILQEHRDWAHPGAGRGGSGRCFRSLFGAVSCTYTSVSEWTHPLPSPSRVLAAVTGGQAFAGPPLV